MLLCGVLTVDPASAARNQYFMQVYAGRTMNKRATPVVTIPESSIQSGDFLGIIRWVVRCPLLFLLPRPPLPRLHSPVSDCGPCPWLRACPPVCTRACSFDGLDPMLAWAMGSTTGHTAITVRDPVSGQLFVHESTVKVGAGKLSQGSARSHASSHLCLGRCTSFLRWPFSHVALLADRVVFCAAPWNLCAG